MKVMHVDTAASWRGGQNQVLLTAHGQAARGHDVLVACRRGGVLETRAREAGLAVRALPFHGDVWPPAVGGLARTLREARPDVVQLHDPHAVGNGVLASRLAPLWRPAAHRRHHPRIRHLVRAFLAHLNLAPGPDIPGPAPSPTTPPPPRNPRQAAHRRCPITGSTQPPGPRSAPLPPPLTTAGFRAHHPRKESAPNGAVSAPSRVLRPVHHGIPRPPCRPPPAPRRAACR